MGEDDRRKPPDNMRPRDARPVHERRRHPLVDAGPGHATVALDVGAAHINFNGKCHGGAIFTLADTAFGLASNSHGVIAVGIDAHITYHVAAQAGDTLTATAVEVSRTRRIAVYRIEVKRSDGTLVAGFTGTVYVLAQPNEGGKSRLSERARSARERRSRLLYV